jgi:hypothetical protein
MKYLLADGPNPPIEVELEPPPPCLFCDAAVETPSYESPLVCELCVQSQHPDGTRWTHADTEERWRNRRRRIDVYRALETTRTVHIPMKFHEKRLVQREGFLHGFVAAKNPRTHTETLRTLQEAEKALRLFQEQYAKEES